MVLLIDLGNTRFKWGLLKKDGTLQLGQSVVIDNGLFDELDHVGLNQIVPERILVSSVASPGFEHALVQWSRKIGEVEINFIRSQTSAMGVTNAYEQPEKLGVDRWLCLIAVWNRDQLPACIVDCGTAITLDVLDQQGQHLGGLIIPGLGLMRESLVRGTSGIHNSGESPGDLLGTDTDSAIHSGVTQAACGAIERVFQQLRDQMGENLKLYITGGDGSWVARQLSFESEVAPALVLEGLAVFARKAS